MHDHKICPLAIAIFIGAFCSELIHVNTQKSCSFSTVFSNTSATYLHHFSSSKCLEVSGFGFKPSSKLILNECSYWGKPVITQQFYIVNSSLGKKLLKMDNGMGEKLCVTTQQGKVYNALCQSLNFDQNWTFKPVQGQKGQYIMEQYSSKKCLIPKSRLTGSQIELKPCNAYETEQIWKICS